ncbi:MAG: hypothetical protein KatS3mg109_0116 [Pirellulaceae bacterium]|nr:MAG: hypothetical protein KatS3mg109_0116 [Pirellulaceae bacterium]
MLRVGDPDDLAWAIRQLPDDCYDERLVQRLAELVGPEAVEKAVESRREAGKV